MRILRICIISIFFIFIVPLPLLSAKQAAGGESAFHIPTSVPRILSPLVSDSGDRMMDFSIKVEDTQIKITFFGEKGSRIQPRIFVTMPDNSVKQFLFTDEQIVDGFVRTEFQIHTNIPAILSGKYVVEMLDDRGLPVFKEAVLVGTSPNELGTHSSKVGLDLLNEMRTKQGLMALKNDATLQEVALKKAQHMRDEQYIGHKSLGGKDIFSFVDPSKNSPHKLGENVAGGRYVTFRKLQYEILDSPAHRANVLNPFWKKVGMAEVRKGDNYYLVQVFSE